MSKTLPGVRKTTDAVVQGVVPQPKRKKKEPTLTKEERTKRREEIEQRKEVLEKEYGEKGAKLKRSLTEAQRMRKNLESEYQRHQAEVRGEREKYMDSTPDGYVDKMLKLKLKTPAMAQLETNIKTFDIDAEEFRKELEGIGREKASLDKELRLLQCNDIAEEALERTRALLEGQRKLEEEFKKLQSLVREGESIDKNWLRPMEQQFTQTEIVCLATFLPQARSLGVLVSQMEELGGAYASTNPLHRDYEQRSEKPYQSLRLRRSSFGVNERGDMALGVER